MAKGNIRKPQKTNVLHDFIFTYALVKCHYPFIIKEIFPVFLYPIASVQISFAHSFYPQCKCTIIQKYFLFLCVFLTQ